MSITYDRTVEDLGNVVALSTSTSRMIPISAWRPSST